MDLRRRVVDGIVRIEQGGEAVDDLRQIAVAHGRHVSCMGIIDGRQGDRARGHGGN